MIQNRANVPAVANPGPETRSTVSLPPLAALFALGWGSNQFAPLILFYPQITPITPVGIQGLFVLYGASLIPALLMGGWLSDRFGRPRVVLAALALAIVSTGLLLLGGLHPEAIVVARVLIGGACGIGFSSATAWASELSPGPRGARLAVAFMVAGMGMGALCIGTLAAWLLRFGASDPQVWVMLPHLLLTAPALVLVVRRLRSETVLPAPRRSAHGAPASCSGSGLRDGLFLRVVLPLAPWTLLCTAVPLAVLPSAIGREAVADPLQFSAFLTPLPALGALFAQPFAGRAGIRPRALAQAAMTIAAAAIGLGILAVERQSLALLLITCTVFGLAHGFCQTAGLRIVSRISPPSQLGRNTAVFQALSYIGFLAPLPIAVLAQHLPLTTVLLGILVLALLTLALLLVPMPRAPSKSE